jgi:chemotaxis response regulator CheB
MTPILIVNDSPVLASVMRAVVLAGSGFEVAGVFSNGAEALAEIGRLKPDLVLMDIHMPGMNGVETTRKMLERHPGTRILITTATVNRNMRLIFDGLKNGAVDFVRSPSLPYAPGTRLATADLRKAGGKLLQKIRTALTVSDLRRFEEKDLTRHPAPVPDLSVSPPRLNGKHPLLGIGCSTGGPKPPW